MDQYSSGASDQVMLTQTALPEIPVGGHEPVSIRKATNGFIVDVGCRTFVATTFEDVVDGLRLFYTDRKEAVKKYCK